VGGRGGRGSNLRCRLGSPSSLEDLPFSRVFLIVRRHHHYPFAFVKGGCFSGNLSQGKWNGCYGGFRGWFGEDIAGGDADEGGCWGRRLGEVGVVSEV